MKCTIKLTFLALLATLASLPVSSRALGQATPIAQAYDFVYSGRVADESGKPFTGKVAVTTSR